MKMTKRKKVFLIVLLCLVLIVPWLISVMKYTNKIKYCVDLLTGQTYEKEVSVEELIEAFVDKSNPFIYRHYAASKLGHELKDPSAVEPLIRVLQDKTEEDRIRAEAAFTLGLIGDGSAIDALVEALNDEPIRRKVIKALTMIEDEGIVEPLLEIAKNGNATEKRVAALGLKVDRPEIVTVLVDLVKNEPEARYTAIKSLGETRTKNEEAFQVLLEVLSNERRLLRKTAAIALGKIGDKRAVELLIKILEGDVEVDVEAAIALGDLGDKRALGPLKKKMEEYKDEAYIMKDLNKAYRKLTRKAL
jgi:HEAT repeat protein